MDKHSDWSSTLRDRVRDIEVSPSKSLWDDIEQSLDGELTPKSQPATQPNYILRWLSGVAAAAAVVVAILILDKSPEFNETTPLQEELVLISELEEQSQPMEQIIPEVEPLHIVQSIQSIKSSEVVDVSVIYQQSAQGESVKQSESSEVLDDSVVMNESTTSEYSESDIPTKRQYRPDNTLAQREEFTPSQRGSKTTISLLGSGALATSQSNSHFAYPTAYDVLLDIEDVENVSIDDIYDSCSATHRQPFSVGLRVQQNITPRFRWVSGLNYTNLISNITLSSNFSEQQQMHFIGVPLRFDYQIISKEHFSLYAGAGGAIEYCVRASLAGEKMDEKRLHYSTGIALGAEYRINHWLGIYFEPEVNYFITETKLKSIRNDNPINLTLRLGVSFTI